MLWVPQAFLDKVNLRTNLPLPPFPLGTWPVLWGNGKRMDLEEGLASTHCSTSFVKLGKLLNSLDH